MKIFNIAILTGLLFFITGLYAVTVSATDCQIGQWTGTVNTLNGIEPAESVENMVSNGVMRIPPSLASTSYYWTQFKLAVPSNFSGDNAKLEVKLKDPYSEGGIGAYDTWVNIIGSGDSTTDKVAGVNLMGDSWGQYWNAIYAGDSIIRSIPELVVPLDNWHTVTVETNNNILSIYYDGSKIKELSYTGQVGNIKYIDIGFKGSGSIDDVTLYENDNLVLQDTFNKVSDTQLFCNTNTGILNIYPIDGYRVELTANEASNVLDTVNLPQFNYAIINHRFDIKKLSLNDRNLLISLLIAKGISMDFTLFQGKASDNLKKKKDNHFKKWNKTLDVAIQKIDESDDIGLLTGAELIAKTAFNIADGVVDAISLGELAGSKKTLKALAKIDKRTKSYRNAIKLKKVFESKELKLVNLLVKNGFLVTNEALDIINSDKSLQEQLKNIGVFNTELAVNVIIEEQKMSQLKGFVAGKLSQALIAFFSDAITEKDLDINSAQLLSNAVDAILDVIPIIGSMREEMAMTKEVLSRQNPEQIIAWKNYMDLQAQFRKETDALNKEITLLKLQMTLTATEQRFENIGGVHF